MNNYLLFHNGFNTDERDAVFILPMTGKVCSDIQSNARVSYALLCQKDAASVNFWFNHGLWTSAYALDKANERWNFLPEEWDDEDYVWVSIELDLIADLEATEPDWGTDFRVDTEQLIIDHSCYTFTAYGKYDGATHETPSISQNYWLELIEKHGISLQE